MPTFKGFKGMKDKRVFICGITQESNNFNPVLAQKSNFAIRQGEIVTKKGANWFYVDGVLNVLEEAGITPLKDNGIFMSAGSGGPVNSELVEWFKGEVVKGLKAEGEVDGVVVLLHGATVSDKSQDVCGDVCETIRKIVGEKTVITAAFDLHANITKKILDNVDYISGYQTYPHLDIPATSARATKKMVEHFKNGRAYVATARVPVIAPASTYTTSTGMLGDLMKKAKALVEDGKIIDYSIFQVQPWLDVEEMAASIVITAKNPDDAIRYANELAIDEFELREDLQKTDYMTIQEVIDLALNNKTGKPVVLVDSADSPNAGAPSDSAEVLRYLLPYKDQLRCALSVTDPDAVKKAFEIGVGNVGDFELGGKLAPKLYKPVTVKGATVQSLHTGEFFMHGPQERGGYRNLGKTAVLRIGKIYIHIPTRGGTEGDKNYYNNFGMDPELMNLVCVKACTSFRAGYQTFSAEICSTDTPGAASPMIKKLPYERRPKPLYPFEEVTVDDIIKAKIYRK